MDTWDEPPERARAAAAARGGCAPSPGVEGVALRRRGPPEQVLDVTTTENTWFIRLGVNTQISQVFTCVNTSPRSCLDQICLDCLDMSGHVWISRYGWICLDMSGFIWICPT